MNATHSLLVQLIPASVFVVALGMPTTIPAQEFASNEIYAVAPIPQLPQVHAIMRERRFKARRGLLNIAG